MSKQTMPVTFIIHVDVELSSEKVTFRAFAKNFELEALTFGKSVHLAINSCKSSILKLLANRDDIPGGINFDIKYLFRHNKNWKSFCKNILSKPYSWILIQEDEGGYSAKIVEFPGCIAEGDTYLEAISNLNITAESWIVACLERGVDIPEPECKHPWGGPVILKGTSPIEFKILSALDDGPEDVPDVVGDVVLKCSSKVSYSEVRKSIKSLIDSGDIYLNENMMLEKKLVDRTGNIQE